MTNGLDGNPVRIIGRAAQAGPQIAPEQRRAMAMQLAVQASAHDLSLDGDGLVVIARKIEAYLLGDQPLDYSKPG